MSDPTHRSAPSSSSRREIRVLGTFQFRLGDSVVSAGTRGSQRLVAFLALQDRAVTRSTVAGTLWPDVDDEHAASSLRSALARLPAPVRAAVVTTAAELGLDAEIDVDLRDARALAHRLVDPTDVVDVSRGDAAIESLSQNVLPDWYDDWVIIEAEEWRQLRLRALEALAGRFTAQGRYGEALGAALAAVRVDGLRESARAAVIRVHLAEGNRSEALRELERYRSVLLAELGLEPTERLRNLLRD